METVIFDGRARAKAREEKLKKRVDKLLAKGVTPRLSTFLIGDYWSNRLYIKMKGKAAERIGAKLDVYEITAKHSYNRIGALMRILNDDKDVHGIMVQLPIHPKFRRFEMRILSSINPDKDVDGMVMPSKFVPATVKGVIDILKEVKMKKYIVDKSKIVVMGSEGMVGSQMVKHLLREGYRVKGVDIKQMRTVPNRSQYWKAVRHMKIAKLASEGDVLITATGDVEWIGKEHVKWGGVVIDVGAPKPEAKKDELIGHAKFITPVPGGVGPMTVISLMDNLVTAAEKLTKEPTDKG